MMPVQQRMSNLLFDQTAVVVVVDVVVDVRVGTGLPLPHLRRSEQAGVGQRKGRGLSSSDRAKFSVSWRRRVVGGGGGEVSSVVLE